MYMLLERISLDAQNVLKKAKETPLVHEGRPLQVTADYVPTEDRSILMVTNLSPDTNVETLKNCVETKKQTDVIKIILGKHGKAVIILQEEIKGIFWLTRKYLIKLRRLSCSRLIFYVE